MNIQKRFGLIFILLLLSEHTIYADGTGREAVIQRIRSFRDEVYMQKKADDELFDQYISVKAFLESTNIPQHDKLFYSAELEYYMGRAYQSFDTLKTVVDHYNASRDGKYLSLRQYYTKPKETLKLYGNVRAYLDRYLELSPDSGGHRLYGEVLGQIILLEDFGFLLKHGPTIPDYIETSLALDPDNVKARILEAGEKIYSPRLFGGNPNKGIDMLLSLLDGGITNGHGPDREDLFNIYSGIGYAYAVLGKNNDALLWFRKALRIYPGNVFARGMIEIVR